MRRQSAALLVLPLLALSAWGGERSVKLAGGTQATLVELRCSTCHSLDYILMNSPFLTRTASGSGGAQDDEGDGRSHSRERCRAHRRLPARSITALDSASMTL